MRKWTLIFFEKKYFCSLGPSVSQFWWKSEHSTFEPKNHIFLILYHFYIFFANLWGISTFLKANSHYFNKTSSVVYIRLMLKVVEHLRFALGCSPSRNCQPNPTINYIFCGARRAKPAERRSPPKTLKTIGVCETIAPQAKFFFKVLIP